MFIYLCLHIYISSILNLLVHEHTMSLYLDFKNVFHQHCIYSFKHKSPIYVLVDLHLSFYYLGGD